MKYVTLKDIARVAEVSYATVSRALSGSGEIGEATRQRILKISRDMPGPWSSGVPGPWG